MSLKQRANHQRLRYQKRQKLFTVWVTKNKRRIPVHLMKTSHIQNTMKYFSPSKIVDAYIREAYGELDVAVPAGCFNPAIQTVMKAELRRRKVSPCSTRR